MGGRQGLPDEVAAALATVLDGAAVAFAPADGFYASAFAGVATGPSGRALFVKGVEAWRPMAADYPVEAAVAAALPAWVPAPRLRFTGEVADWLVLGFDVVRGRTPREPWEDGDLALVLDALGHAAPGLTPSPLPGLPTVADRMRGRHELWGPIVAGAADLATVGAWEHRHADRLAALEQRFEALVAGPSLVHFDLRHSNVLVDAEGGVSFVDWGRASVGPSWVDVACLLLASRVTAEGLDALFTPHPLARDAAPDAVDALLTVLLGHWTLEAPRPPHPFIHGLRERQEQSRLAARAWLQQRWHA
jgi:aminoglycoside phosphotransferase (APT) family kinase protein